MHQYGVLHGLLAGVTALIRGAYESEGLAKALLDALLCCIIGLFAFHVAATFDTFKANVTMQLVLAIVIGVVGANLRRYTQSIAAVILRGHAPRPVGPRSALPGGL